MKMTQYLKWKADPSKGEVFTPTELVNEMLNQIPEIVWKNPNSTFLDPCCGKGTFIIEIVNRLVYIYGYTESDAKKRVYGYDIRIKYFNHLVRRGFINLRCNDFLKENLDMKFDVVIGNPPYQDKDKPGDNVVATGVGATVKDFAQVAFEHVGLNYKDHIEVDKRYQRPTEVDALIGDPSQAEKVLGWKAKTDWKVLAKLMVDADIEKVKSNS